MSKSTGIFRSLGLALVLALGFGIVFAFAAGWGYSVLEGFWQRERVSENLEVREDGTPLIQRITYHAEDGYQQNETFHTLDGNEVPNPKNTRNQEGPGLLSGVSLHKPGQEISNPTLDADARVGRFSDLQTPNTKWYFLHNGVRDGRGYFVGYDSQSTLGVGFIGREGFRADLPPAEQWFPVDGGKLAGGWAFSDFNTYGFLGDSYYGEVRSFEFSPFKVEMISGTQVLQVDLRNRSVTTVMESPDLIAVGVLETNSTSKAVGADGHRAPFHWCLAVRTVDRVLVFDAPGKQRAAYVLPEGLRDGGITLYEVAAGTALVTTSHLLPDHSQREELNWIDGSGKVLQHEEVSLGEANPHYEENEAWGTALFLPAPVALAVLASVAMPLDHLGNGLAANYAAALAQSLATYWPVLLVVTLVSAALAWYCCRRQRRYYQQFSGVWFVFVLVTGLPGLVGYLFHRRWPVLEKCPACGAVVPRDREACAKCRAAFPPPAPKGCEVFA